MNRPIQIILLGISLATAGAVPPSSPVTPQEAVKLAFQHVAIHGKLQQAVNACQTLLGVPILVDWSAIKATGVTENAKVAVEAAEASGGQVLDLVLVKASAKDAPLAWKIAGDFIIVSTQQLIMNPDFHGGEAGPAAARAANAPAGAAPAATQRAAVRRYDFQKTPLADVVDFFRTATGENFNVNWTALEAAGVTRQTPVTLDLSDAPWQRALEMVTDQLGAPKARLDRVYWVADREMVTISTGTALDTVLRTRVYDVASLLVTVPNFKAPRFDPSALSAAAGQNPSSGSSGNGSGSSGGIFGTGSDQQKSDNGDTSAAKDAIGESLMGIIRDSIGADMWQPQGRGSIRIFRGKLIITQSLLGFRMLEGSWHKESQ